MLFNSYVFIFVFLPVVLAGYYALVHFNFHSIARTLLVISCFIFYGYFDYTYAFLLFASVIGNFLVGDWLCRTKAGQSRRQLVMVLGVIANLSLLGYYKYLNFVLDNITALGIHAEWTKIILPLGISFFTFQQIAYIVDIYNRKVHEPSFINYALFVSFFPQLIAGPIVHHKEMMPQFARRQRGMRYSDLAIGLTIFAFGLFKKVVIADTLALYASPVFQAADSGLSVTTMEAWGGALAYTLQLYFDFCGYSDMAIGLARLFGIRLPLNFFSPYKAVDIIDFWRRWHMTLSRFLRDYVYIPLGGNRHGPLRRYINLFLTMLLGGIWHGAGWTFVVWGLMHGSFLILNHAWRQVKQRFAARVGWTVTLPRPGCVALTFMAVVFAWVVFRAETLSGAGAMLRAMLCLDGITVPVDVYVYLGRFGPLAEQLGVAFDGENTVGLRDWASAFPFIGMLMLVVWFAPNVAQIMGRYNPTISTVYWDFVHSSKRWFVWQPGWGGTAATVAATVLSIFYLSRASEFLYFQF